MTWKINTRIYKYGFWLFVHFNPAVFWRFAIPRYSVVLTVRVPGQLGCIRSYLDLCPLVYIQLDGPYVSHESSLSRPRITDHTVFFFFRHCG